MKRKNFAELIIIIETEQIDKNTRGKWQRFQFFLKKIFRLAMHIGFLSFGIVVWCCVVCVVFSYIYNYIFLQFIYLYRYNHVYICMHIVIRVKKQPLFANYFVVWRSSVFFSFLFSNNTHTHSNVLILVLQHMALIITNECYYIFLSYIY